MDALLTWVLPGAWSTGLTAQRLRSIFPAVRRCRRSVPFSLDPEIRLAASW